MKSVTAPNLIRSIMFPSAPAKIKARLSPANRLTCRRQSCQAINKITKTAKGIVSQVGTGKEKAIPCFQRLSGLNL